MLLYRFLHAATLDDRPDAWDRDESHVIDRDLTKNISENRTWARSMHAMNCYDPFDHWNLAEL